MVAHTLVDNHESMTTWEALAAADLTKHITDVGGHEMWREMGWRDAGRGGVVGMWREMGWRDAGRGGLRMWREMGQQDAGQGGVRMTRHIVYVHKVSEEPKFCFLKNNG